jgi:hypothetical protein
MSISLTYDTSPTDRVTVSDDLHVLGSIIIEGGMFANSTAAPDANSLVRRDWVDAHFARSILIANTASLPSGTPAGVVVFTQA